MPDDRKKDSKDDGKKSGCSSQTGQVGGFRNIPFDFDAGNDGDNKKNKKTKTKAEVEVRKSRHGFDIHLTIIPLALIEFSYNSFWYTREMTIIDDLTL